MTYHARTLRDASKPYCYYLGTTQTRRAHQHQHKPLNRATNTHFSNTSHQTGQDTAMNVSFQLVHFSGHRVDAEATITANPLNAKADKEIVLQGTIDSINCRSDGEFIDAPVPFTVQYVEIAAVIPRIHHPCLRQRTPHSPQRPARRAAHNRLRRTPSAPARRTRGRNVSTVGRRPA